MSTDLNENISRENEVAAEEPKAEKKGFFAKLTSGLAKTRGSILSGVGGVLKTFVKVDEELLEELEETLIMSDFGVKASGEIIAELRNKIKTDKIADADGVKAALIEIISGILTSGENDEPLKTPAIILIVGVNGVGKTTTIGKLAKKYSGEGKRVIVAAADTFRAAAVEQLEVWSQRSGAHIIKQTEGSDPGAVIFDAISAAKARKADILICDTAGRLHNKKNLMDELGKINKIITGQFPEAHKETFIVLDATAGQNSISQVKTFQEVCGVTGIILTKLDGTAKGGVVTAIKSELSVPVKYVGVGEGADDLETFDAGQFARALFYGDN